MPILDIYSKRQKRQNKKTDDVFTYDSFPDPFRIQFLYILRDLANPEEPNIEINIYNPIDKFLCREYGRFYLTTGFDKGFNSLSDFILKTNDPDKVLDVIETSIRMIGVAVDNYRFQNSGVFIKKDSYDQAIKELNYRFIEHSLGYQFESGKIMRVDSHFIHSEVVIPALAILNDEEFEGANDEFRKAHDHYRHGNYKDCLSDCLKAFESTIKSICTNQEWDYNKTDTAKTLIDICIKNGLFPDYLLSNFTALRSILESGIPTLRNKLSGHGQGPETIEVPSYFAAYQLHLTASAILFLADAEKNLKRQQIDKRA